MTRKIILPGGAGLVGQNLVARLQGQEFTEIVVLDKHRANLSVLREIHPHVIAEYADLSRSGGWQRHFRDADVVVMLQAQIGGNSYEDFVRNNIDSTRLIVAEIIKHSIPYVLHVSSSVVAAPANDFYSKTKKEQECIVMQSGIACPVLRPTLMFGWFDRKHFGWLSRFMQKWPIFPVPGNGRYARQPLYVGDFCNIIISCITNEITAGIYNISGREKIDYIDIIREIKRATRARAAIVRIPYPIFYTLLWLWGVLDRNPPFTTQQLAALIAGDEFEVIDWPGIFGVVATPFARALEETFNHRLWGRVVLKF